MARGDEEKMVEREQAEKGFLNYLHCMNTTCSKGNRKGVV